MVRTKIQGLFIIYKHRFYCTYVHIPIGDVKMSVFTLPIIQSVV